MPAESGRRAASEKYLLHICNWYITRFRLYDRDLLLHRPFCINTLVSCTCQAAIKDPQNETISPKCLSAMHLSITSQPQPTHFIVSRQKERSTTASTADSTMSRITRQLFPRLNNFRVYLFFSSTAISFT